MSPNTRVARTQLSYPLYGADFDPLNPDFLLVGGGGGPTSSGVPNKITLLDTSRLEAVKTITDIELAKNEDSVMSLAVAESSETSLTAYAGINSSIKDQEAGSNEHFRSFKIALPTRRRKAENAEKSTADAAPEFSKAQALNRTSMFMSAPGSKGDAYQRVLRVSPAHEQGGERMAAIASGLATKNEVLVLRATSLPSPSNVVSRINVESGEAADLDMVPVEDQAKSHVLAYCTDCDVYLQHIPTSSGKGVKEPIKVFSHPSASQRSKIRCLRWLNARYLLLLRNRPARGGADLVILKTDQDYTQVKEVLLKVLSRSTKQAVGLATCALSTSTKGDQQFVVAVAGQDSSLEILSVDLLAGSGMTKFRQYAHLRNVHSSSITRITFSTFKPPPMPVSKDTRPQYIRLASVGVDMNVVVQTLPLRPYPAIYTKTPRYVLIPPPETVQNAINILVAILIIGVVAFCMQIFCEIKGAVPPTLNAQSWLSPKWHAKLVSPYPYHKSMPGPMLSDSLPPVINSVISATSETASLAADTVTPALLTDLLASKAPDQQIVMRDAPAADCPDGSECQLETELVDRHSDEVQQDQTIKKWDQLSDREKTGWRKRLVDAGHWTETQGESVLKGILFSELGAAVGAAVRGG